MFSAKFVMATTHHKSVIDGVLQHVSVSQIKTFRDCPRRWATEKVLDMAGPPGRAQSVGLKAHKEVEAYLKGGPLPAKRWAPVLNHATIPLWVRPAPTYAVEMPLSDPTISIAHVPVEGFVDLFIFAPNAHETDQAPRVIDWKFTSSFEHMLSKKALAQDPQSVIYAMWTFAKYPQIAQVRVRFVYCLTSGEPTAQPVDVSFVRSDIEVHL